MIKQTSLVSKTKFSDVVKTDASVDMNSIVAFFISKYENNLLETKKHLSARIKELNDYLDKDFRDLVKADVKLDSYKVNVKALGLTTTAEIQFTHRDLYLNKSVSILISEDEKKTKNCRFSMEKKATVSDELHTKYVEVDTEIETLRNTLRETLENITNISRKERELRGALAEKTLRDAGVGDLFDDAALLNLVSLPSISTKTI